MIIQGNVCSSKKNIIIECLFYFIALLLISFLIIKCKYYWTLDGDVAPQTYALFSHVGRCLHNGELPLWNPGLYGGESNIGLMITQAFYPINWILSYLFFNPKTGIVGFEIITFSLIFHLFLFYCGFNLLLRKQKINKIVAFITPLLSIYSIQFRRYVEWVGFVDSFCWFPIIITTSLYLIDAESEGKNLIYTILLGIEFACLASLGAGPMLILEALFIIILFLIVRFSWKNFVKLILAGTIGILLSAPVLLSNYSFMKSSLRYVPEMGFIPCTKKVTLEIFRHYKELDIQSLFCFFPGDSFISTNAIIILFASFSFAKKNENYESFKKISLIAFLLSLLLCVGLLFDELFYYIPFVNAMREMFLYGILLNFFISILAAFGIMNVLCLKQINVKNLKIIVSIVLLLFIYNFLPHRGHIKFNLIFSFIILLFFIFSYCNKKNIALSVLLLLSAFTVFVFVKKIDCLSFSGEMAIEKVKQTNMFNNSIFSALNIKNHERIYSYGNRCYPSNNGIALGLKEVQNYANPVNKLSHNSLCGITGNKYAILRNIKYLFINEDNSKEFISSFHNQFPNIMAIDRIFSFISTWSGNDKAKCQIYQIQTNGPGWFVTDYDFYSDEKDVFKWINSLETKLEEKVLINEKILSKKGKEKLGTIKSSIINAKIKDIDYKNNRVIYDVFVDSNCIFIASEVFDNGWKVYIDNRKTELLNVDYSNRAVFVPQGNHVIKFVYRPVEFLVGIIMQAICICCIIVTTVLILRKKNSSIIVRERL